MPSHSQSSPPASAHAASRPQPAATVSRNIPRRGDGYTLTHGGRQVRIGPVAFWIVVGTLMVMAVWSVATGSYFAFKENVLTRLIGRQAEMQFAYEDRIAELRAQVDRVTSRQLLDQEQFEQKLEVLLHRQAALESRSAALGGDPSVVKASRGKAAPQKPSPINDNGSLAVPPERRTRLEGEPSQARPRLFSGKLGATMDRVASSMDKIEQRQNNALGAMQEKLNSRLRYMQGVLGELGVSLGKHGDDVTGSIGGPYIPLKQPARTPNTFERELSRVNYVRAQVDQVSRELGAIPLRKPVDGDIDMSSPFGTRMDPFLGGPAIHTGVDLRGDTGEPAHATANGTVTIASWSGGYGNMVEIDHHNGLSTRYGHLSKLLVKVGQRVSIGEVIGLIGSTGRSTGPHLHYETRVNDSAVDPQKFLRAGERLGTF
jgi:murein DD-endopeptidase MepM/ murein hydrolase activator NlpD